MSTSDFTRPIQEDCANQPSPRAARTSPGSLFRAISWSTCVMGVMIALSARAAAPSDKSDEITERLAQMRSGHERSSTPAAPRRSYEQAKQKQEAKEAGRVIYDAANPLGLKDGTWEDVQGVWFGRVNFITNVRGVRRPGATVSALLVIGAQDKFLTLNRPGFGGKTTVERYRLAPPHKVLNRRRELCQVERVDPEGKPLADADTGMVVGLMRPRANLSKEFDRIDFTSEGGSGEQMGSGIFTHPIERSFRPQPFSSSQRFSVIYGNDRPGTTTETRAEGIAALKKLFATFKKQGFYFVHAEEATLAQNEIANLNIDSGPIEKSVFLVYCRGDASRLYVEANQGPGGKYIQINGAFPMYLVLPHKWTTEPFHLTQEFQIWNAGPNEDLTRPAKFGGGSTVEVTILQFSNSFARSHREFNFNKLR